MRGMIHKGLFFLLLVLLALSTAEAARITDKLLAGLYEKPEVSATPLRVLPSDTPLERLEKSGDFTRVRLGDSTEGWVESRFITDEKPARIMLLELQVKNSELQQKLREANKALKALGQTSPESTPLEPDPEIADLKRQLADAKAEIELLKREATPPSESDSRTADNSAALREQINELEQALAEAKNTARQQEQQTDDNSALQQTNQQLQQQLDQIAAIVGLSQDAADSSPAEPAGIRFNAWHLPVLLLALLFSFIGGVAFKNYRLAKRYGGFRI